MRAFLTPASASKGRGVYNRVCAACHKLFGEGGEIGPDLTGSNRADLDYLLENILDPSAVIGRDYQLSTVKTRDGRLVAGMIHAATNDVITLKTLAETVTVPRKDVEALETSDVSMMPEGLFEVLTEVAEVADATLRMSEHSEEVPHSDGRHCETELRDVLFQARP